MLNLQRLSSVLELLLFLVFVYPCNGDTGDETVVVFKGDTTDVSHVSSDGSATTRKPKAFRVPAFVGGVLDDSEFFAVLCDAQYEESAGSPFIQPALKTSLGNYKTWSDAVIFGKKTETNKEYAVLRNVTAVMKGNKIYALATSVKASKELQSTYSGSTTEWDTVMFVGTVVKSTDASGGFSVTWETKTSLKALLPQFVLSSKAVYFYGGVGNGVVMKNGTIVLPVQIKNGIKYSEYNQASSVIYSSDNGTTWHMGSPTQRWPSSEGSVVEWSDGKLLLSVRLDIGFRVVYETDDMGATWKEFSPFTRVWGNNPQNGNDLGSQGSVITASVDDNKILLVSHPLITKNTRTRETLQLWVSDGKRIALVGTISEDDKGEQTGNSILALVGEKLYVTHEINPYGNLNESDTTRGAWDKVIAVSLLQNLFDGAKNTVREWRKLDELFESNGIPADGLVGVLGNTTASAEVWPDVYNCVNGTVSNAESVEGGFRFKGLGDSYAQWPVRNQRQNQVYKFTDKQFTLAATVIIHRTSKSEEVSCFGIGEVIHSKSLLFGLGYTENKKWSILHATNSRKNTDVSFELDTEYPIAITFANEKDFIYVNGVEITSGTTRANTLSSVDFFYMGGTGVASAKEGSSCTVKNVMLFNRTFNKREIARLAHVIKHGNTDEPTTTEEPTKVLDNHETTQTEETTSVPKNKEAQLIEEEISLQEKKKTLSPTATKSMEEDHATVSIPDKTNLLKNEKKFLPTSTTKLPDIPELPSAVKESNLPHNEKTASTEETKIVEEDQAKVPIPEKTKVPGSQRTDPQTSTTKLPDNQETLSAAEEKIEQQIDNTASTAATTSLQDNEKTVSTTEKATLKDNREIASKTDTTKLLEKSETPQTEETTTLQETQKTLSTAEAATLRDNEETLSISDKAQLPEKENTVTTTGTTSSQPSKDTVLTEKPTNSPQFEKTVSKKETTRLPKIQESLQTTQPTKLPEIIKEVSATESKETTVTEKQTLSNVSKKIKNGNLFQSGHSKTMLEEQMNGADNASVPLVFIKIICVIFSFIVLSGV